MSIIYTNDCAAVDRWVEDFGCRAPVLGMDAEYKPVFNKGEYASTSVLQLSTRECALVVQLNAMPGGVAALGKSCPGLAALLSGSSGRLTLAGMAVKADYVKLLRECGIAPSASPGIPKPKLIDLKELGRQGGIDVKGGLSALALAAGIVAKTWKSNSLQMSNWARFPLTERQLVYAAMDAWAGAAAFERLQEIIAEKAGRAGRTGHGAAGAAGGAGAAPLDEDEAEDAAPLGEPKGDDDDACDDAGDAGLDEDDEGDDR